VENKNSDMTKEEILRKHLQKNEHHSDKLPDMFTRFLIYDAMDEYAQQQLKILNMPVVSNNEVVVCDNCGCQPTVIYLTTSGRFCEKCKP
jgi:hypothetical protein